MNRVVILTGAGTGLGLSLAKQLVGRGDTVYGVTRTQRHWKAAKAQFPHAEKFHLSRVDVTSEPQVKRFLARALRQAGRIDVLINNAGYAKFLGRTEKTTLNEFQKNLSANLLSAFLMCKHALPLMKNQKKSWILNISSMAGKRAVPLLSAYSASKFGVVALSQALAKENPEPGFHCITVCPGGMNTEMRTGLFGKKDAERQQSPDFVAEKILEILDGRIEVPSGGDIVIRHGQVTAINPPLEA